MNIKDLVEELDICQSARLPVMAENIRPLVRFAEMVMIAFWYGLIVIIKTVTTREVAFLAVYAKSMAMRSLFCANYMA